MLFGPSKDVSRNLLWQLNFAKPLYDYRKPYTTHPANWFMVSDGFYGKEKSIEINQKFLIKKDFITYLGHLPVKRKVPERG